MCRNLSALILTLLWPALLGAQPAPRADPAAADMLASLSRAAEAVGDIDQAIDRYQRFINTYPGTEAAEEARRHLDVWNDRKNRRMTRIGGRWLTPQEAEELKSSIPAKIDSARQLMSGGQMRDAEPLIAEVLELDPNQIAALYLQGLILYQQDKLPAARKSFEAVNAQIAAHAPTLNNLAVINFRQNQLGPALNLYDQALDAAPRDVTIINNIAEALNSIPEDQRRLSILGRVGRKFADQEAALAAEMQEKGQYRWGAGWVSKEQFDQLVAAEREVQKKIEQYKSEFESLGTRIQMLARQIEDSERELQRIEADSYWLTADGRWLRRALPDYYYQERRRREELVSERSQAIARQKALRQQADRVTQDLPVPKFTGVQKPIGIEGTPIEPPATQPS